jgi:hypothetical protein
VNHFKAVSALLLLMSITFFGAAFWGFQKSEFLKHHGVRCTAVVSKLEYSSSISTNHSGESGVYYPFFSFRLKDGSEKTVKSLNGSDPPAYRKGDQLELLYDEKDPSNFSVDNWWDLYLLPTVFAAVAAILLPIGIGLAVVRWQRIQGQNGQKQDLKRENNIFDRDSRR